MPLGVQLPSVSVGEDGAAGDGPAEEGGGGGIEAEANALFRLIDEDGRRVGAPLASRATVPRRAAAVGVGGFAPARRRGRPLGRAAIRRPSRRHTPRGPHARAARISRAERTADLSFVHPTQ
jgi:hypothetical protein